MSLHIANPSSFLSAFVKQYWAIENTLPKGRKHVQRIIPCGLPDLTFYFEDKPETESDHIGIDAVSQISGQRKKYFDYTITGKLSLFSIVFKPQGLMVFFDFPISELFNQNIPLEYLLKEEVAKLETDLYNSSTFEKKVEVAERFLFDRLRKTQKKWDLSRILHSINLIDRSRGRIKIDQLASEVCLSRKQFERIFSNFVGASPKQFLKIVRFQNVLFEKSQNQGLNLTELAYQCDYFDQSHMIGEFKAFAGMTPRRYFAKGEPFSDYFG